MPHFHARRPLPALLAVTLLATVLSVATSTPAQAQSNFVINEVDYASSVQIVELHNPTSGALNTGGLVLDTDEDDQTLPQLASVSVPAGGFHAVCMGGDSGPDCDQIANATLPTTGYVVLETVNGTDIDRVSWNGNQRGEGAPDSFSDSFDAETPGKSLSRCADGADTGTNTVDFRRSDSTPGAANFCPTLVVNELSHVGGTDFVEVRNTSGSTVDLTDYSYTYGTISASIVLDMTGTLTAGALRSFNVNLPDDQGGVFLSSRASFQILDRVAWGGGDALFLPEGDPIEITDPDTGTNPTGTHGLSRCGEDNDSTGTDFFGLVATPGGANACPDVRINEVDYAVGSDELVFVELLNVGDSPVDVFDLRLVFPIDGANLSTAGVGSRGGTLAADGGRATFCWGDGPDSLCTVEFEAGDVRPVDGPAGVAVISRWSQGGWDLITWEGGGLFSGLEEGSATTALSDPGAGMSLTRCPEATSGEPAATTLPDVAVRSPSLGAPNVCTDAAPALMINEVDHAGDTDTVEIHNPGSESVALDGHSLVIDPPRREIALNGMVPAMGYRTICLAHSSTSECDQEVADASLPDGPSGVALRDGDNTVLDAVSWGGGGVAPDTTAEGGQTTSLIDSGDPAGNSLSRCPDGTDTDVNTDDFSLQARSPGVANPCNGPVGGETGGSVISIPTDDATATSIAFAQLVHPDPRTRQAGPQEVLVASDTVFADALASGSLQGTRPLLLNDRDTLEPEVLAEIQRLGATTVRVLGGTAAIADPVILSLQQAGLTAVRTFGPTRLETAEQIAQLAGTPTTAILGRAFPAEGGDDTQAFADTLAAGGWAAAAGFPVLLTQTEVLSTTTQGYLDGGSVQTAQVVGGTAAISTAVTDALGGLGIVGVRNSGATRFATAIAIATAQGFTEAAPAGTVILVEGQAGNAWEAGFTAAGAAASLNAPVVLANGDALPQETTDFLDNAVTPVDGQPTLVCAASAAACTAAQAALGLS